MNQIPDRVRQLVVEWPEDAAHGAVAEFCARHGVSRAWFYAVRARARDEGGQAMLKSSTRPHRSPHQIVPLYRNAIIAERRQLKEAGKDYGPISIRYALLRAGIPGVPSRSTIAKVLDEEQLVDRNRRKRPKKTFKRFAATYPNQRWQSDAFDLQLGDGTERTVIEILDDATRFSLHVHIAASEAAEPVVAAFREAIAEFGRPVLVHTDNGSAFNAERWGRTTQLQAFLHDLGVRMITGRPNSPRSQGKVERGHQTIQRYILAHSPYDEADLIDVVAEYRQWYNHHRAHQALPPNTAPAQAYTTLPKMAPPGEPIVPATKKLTDRFPVAEPLLVQRRAGTRGKVTYRNAVYVFGRAWQGQTLNIIHHPDRLEFFDSDGQFLFHTVWPAEHGQTGVARQVKTPAPPLPGKLENPRTALFKPSTKSSDPNVH